MIKKASELKSGDVFLFENKEQVAIHDYDGADSLWITTKKFFIYPNDDKTYGYTNACVMALKSNDEVDITENLLRGD